MHLIRGSELEPADPARAQHLTPDARQLLAQLLIPPSGRGFHHREVTALPDSLLVKLTRELERREHLIWRRRRYVTDDGHERGVLIVYSRPRKRVRFPENQPERPARYRPLDGP